MTGTPDQGPVAIIMRDPRPKDAYIVRGMTTARCSSFKNQTGEDIKKLESSDHSFLHYVLVISETSQYDLHLSKLKSSCDLLKTTTLLTEWSMVIGH